MSDGNVGASYSCHDRPAWSCCIYMGELLPSPVILQDAPLLSKSKMFKLSGNAWPKALRKSWEVSACRHGKSTKQRSPVVGTTVA